LRQHSRERSHRLRSCARLPPARPFDRRRPPARRSGRAALRAARGVASVSQPITPLRDRRPLCIRVYFELRERIAQGEYPPGSRLPSETDLARAFAVNPRDRAGGASAPAADGLVRAQHGRGHFVLKRGLIREPVTELRSVTELLTSLGYEVESEVLA